MTILKKRNTPSGIVVVDVEGSEFTFGSVKDAASKLQVTAQYIYLAIRTGHKVRGCTIRRAE